MPAADAPELKPNFTRTKEHYRVRPNWASMVDAEKWPKVVWVIVIKDADGQVVGMEVSA